MPDMTEAIEYERRSVPAEIRTEGEGEARKIVGYAAVFDSPSDAGGTFREVIRPGAFRNALAEKQDVRALFNHDSNLVLGRTSAGTLRLSEDSHGLRYEIDPPNTQVARDLMESIDRGDISGSSFAFWPREGGVTRTFPDGELPFRELTDLDVSDVSPVTYPYYETTKSEVRAMQPPAPAPTNNPDLLKRRLELESLR